MKPGDYIQKTVYEEGEIFPLGEVAVIHRLLGRGGIHIISLNKDRGLGTVYSESRCWRKLDLRKTADKSLLAAHILK